VVGDTVEGVILDHLFQRYVVFEKTRDIEIEMSQIDVNPLNNSIAQFFEFLHPSSTASVMGFRYAQQAEGGLFAIRGAYLCLAAKRLYFVSIMTFRSIDFFPL
jgi:hypothetical protein